MSDRESQSTGRASGRIPTIPAIDGFRAYAILGVVLIHLLLVSGVMEATAGTFANVALWGLLGNVIDAFFIISGFLLFLPVVKSGSLGPLDRYAIARAGRLVPAYWLSLVVALALVALLPPNPAFSQPSALNVGLHAVGLQMPGQMLDLGVVLGFGVNGPIWMISVIVGFYVVLPFIAGAYLRRPLLGLALAAAVTIGWKELTVHAGGAFEALADPSSPAWAVQLVASDQLPGWAFSFALGMTGAWGYRKILNHWPREVIRRKASLMLPGALVLYAAFALLYGEASGMANSAVSGSFARADPLEGIGSSASRGIVMASIALGPLWVQRPFANPLAVHLAQLSYGLYLIHGIAIVYLGRYAGLASDGSAMALLVWIVAVLPISLAYAYVSRRLVEAPARRWVRSRERGPQSSKGRLTAPLSAERNRRLGSARD